MIDELETQLLRDAPLQLFDLFVAELDHFPRLYVDQMVVVRIAALTPLVSEMMNGLPVAFSSAV